MGQLELTSFDRERIYCPKLGHELDFNYCRRENIEKPCLRIIKCWQAFLPIADWLVNCFGPTSLKEFEKLPQAKLATIVEITNKLTK